MKLDILKYIKKLPNIIIGGTGRHRGQNHLYELPNKKTVLENNKQFPMMTDEERDLIFGNSFHARIQNRIMQESNYHLDLHPNYEAFLNGIITDYTLVNLLGPLRHDSRILLAATLNATNPKAHKDDLDSNTELRMSHIIHTSRFLWNNLDPVGFLVTVTCLENKYHKIMVDTINQFNDDPNSYEERAYLVAKEIRQADSIQDVVAILKRAIEQEELHAQLKKELSIPIVNKVKKPNKI